MQNQMPPTVRNVNEAFLKPREIFFTVLLLTGFFLFLEVSFFIQCNKVYLSDFTFVSNQLHIPGSILPGVFYFLFAQLLVHFCFCLLTFSVTFLIGYLFNLNKKKIFPLTVSIWLLSILTVLLMNQAYFPNSKFAELFSVFVGRGLFAEIAFIALLISWIGLAFCSSLGFVKLLVKKPINNIFFILLLAIIGGKAFFKPADVIADGSSSNKPNVIIIGMDSVRPDFLGYFGHDNNTPFIDSFLEQASVFSEAVTPAARTYPSWAGILTGQYPIHIGIRFNLAQQTKTDFRYSLPTILKKAGYETVFATDEARFSNIDHAFGFEKIIAPPMGLNDFLLGTFNDFPLSNLIINTEVGRWLFPYSYANRPVYFSYHPSSFLNYVKNNLNKNRHKPLFLSIHFCLTHSPYLWAEQSGHDISILKRYELSIERMDEQLADFFAVLKKWKLLDHAVVVLLSDHGETLEMVGDRITNKELFVNPGVLTTIPQFYPPSLEHEDFDQSAGHGTDVLGLPQYHSLLGFKFYGLEASNQPGVYSNTVMLLDIKPTLLALLKLDHGLTDGVSLLTTIKGDAKLLPKRHIFLESDFAPESIRTIYPDTRKVLLEGIQLFQIDPITTRLTVKPSMGEMIVNSKQYADIYGQWMLALYPQNKNTHIAILVNLFTGEWTNNLQSTLAKEANALNMLAELKTFYHLQTEIPTL